MKEQCTTYSCLPGNHMAVHGFLSCSHTRREIPGWTSSMVHAVCKRFIGILQTLFFWLISWDDYGRVLLHMRVKCLARWKPSRVPVMSLAGHSRENVDEQFAYHVAKQDYQFEIDLFSDRSHASHRSLNEVQQRNANLHRLEVRTNISYVTELFESIHFIDYSGEFVDVELLCCRILVKHKCDPFSPIHNTTFTKTRPMLFRHFYNPWSSLIQVVLTWFADYGKQICFHPRPMYALQPNQNAIRSSLEDAGTSDDDNVSPCVFLVISE